MSLCHEIEEKKLFKKEKSLKTREHMLTHLFYRFSLKTNNFPTGRVIEGQFCIWVTIRIKHASD